MERKTSFSLPAVGGSSLLVIFAVLCLTVFALLSLSTVQAEKRLADASVQAVSAYYEADRQAELIFSQLRQGADIPQVKKSNNVYTYSCPISGTQELLVAVEQTDGHWAVLRWQAVSTADLDSDDTLPVWDGGNT